MRKNENIENSRKKKPTKTGSKREGKSYVPGDQTLAPFHKCQILANYFSVAWSRVYSSSLNNLTL